MIGHEYVGAARRNVMTIRRPMSYLADASARTISRTTSMRPTDATCPVDEVSYLVGGRTAGT